MSSFCFGDIGDCLFIVKIDKITDPLCVLRNYGDEKLRTGLILLCTSSSEMVPVFQQKN